MELQNLVQLQAVVAALNFEPPSPDEKAHFAERYVAAGGDLPRQETRPFAAAQLSSVLRRYVDAWLQTGRRADGREFPWEKRLSTVGYLAVEEYLQQHPPEVSISLHGGLTVCVGDAVGHPRGTGMLYEAAEAEARRLFTGLIASEQKQCLCKCVFAKCGRYFLLAKPRKVYKRGTFCCRSHQMAASALALTSNRRAKAKRGLIELAAQQLLNWRVRSADWADDGRQRLRLARELSQHMRRNPNLRANRRQVKVNWVTRHRQQIEQKRVRIQKNGRS
jgi:hypothetical protein